MDTDRNLLFGVLALQADLIDRQQFAEACSAWAGHRHARLHEPGASRRPARSGWRKGHDTLAGCWSSISAVVSLFSHAKRRQILQILPRSSLTGDRGFASLVLGTQIKSLIE